VKHRLTIINRNCVIPEKSGIFNTAANIVSNLAYKSVLTFQMQSKHVTITIKDKYNSHAHCELTVIILISLTGTVTATLHILFISYR